MTAFAWVLLEATSLFEASQVITGRFDDQVRAFQGFGPRYDAGVRFSF